MGSLTLEEAAARLVERLRSTPFDALRERVPQRGERADAIFAQANRDGEDGCAVLRELLARVEAARDRLREARGRVQDGDGAEARSSRSPS